MCWQVGVDLGKPGYLEEVAKQTADIDVAVVFCNAGYMLTGFFDSMCAVQPPAHWPGRRSSPWMSQAACTNSLLLQISPL
jgi:hypothetical protein